MEDKSKAKLYIVLVSVHGLIRAKNTELGRDADTGGQIKYVLELSKILSTHPEVLRVDLLTRLIEDSRVSQDYSKAYELIAPKSWIIRLPCGGYKRYMRKELLWNYLDSFADNSLQYFRKIGILPSIIHGHYADGGYIASKLGSQLDIPVFHTAHSLGRVKKKWLLRQGFSENHLEQMYNFKRRIEAEEVTMDIADRIISSTKQEIEEQYSLYDNYERESMIVIPSGVDLKFFYPNSKQKNSKEKESKIEKKINAFFKEPKKPLIISIARPDPKKNICTLIRAYANSEKLKKTANLLLVMGNRDNIRKMERCSRDFLIDIFLLIDLYNLYGLIAYPKHHKTEDIPEFYRLGAKLRGVFVNPAVTEPFGLTIIESSASGLPIIATNDGGPKEILEYCQNGMVINPLNENALTKALEYVLSDQKRWKIWSRKGIIGVKKHFSWDAHVKQYVKEIKKVLQKSYSKKFKKLSAKRLLINDRLLVCHMDNILLGDKQSLKIFLKRLKQVSNSISLGIITRYNFNEAFKIMNRWNIPEPEVLISSLGAEIHYGSNRIIDQSWQKHINHRWDSNHIQKAMKIIPGISMQKNNFINFKISYNINSIIMPQVRKIKSHLRKSNLHANVVFSHNRFLDILPIRVTLGLSLRFFASKWGIDLEKILLIGDSVNNMEMLRGNTLAVVVDNKNSITEKLKEQDGIYFAKNKNALGMIEGIDYYKFFN